MLLALLIIAVLFAVAGIFAAFRFGGAPERAGGMIIVMMLFVPRLAHLVYPKVFAAIDPAAFVTDVAALIAFGAIALRARRYWPIWVSALQLLSVSAHLIRWFDIKVEPLVYAAMSGAPSYLISLTVALASLAAHRRRRTKAMQF